MSPALTPQEREQAAHEAAKALGPLTPEQAAKVAALLALVRKRRAE